MEIKEAEMGNGLGCKFFRIGFMQCPEGTETGMFLEGSPTFGQGTSQLILILKYFFQYMSKENKVLKYLSSKINEQLNYPKVDLLGRKTYIDRFI
jgi:hypothetical protein